VSIAAFGYLLNDFYDREADILSGKNNILSTYNFAAAFSIVLLSLAIGLVSWFFFNAGTPANILMILQLAALFAYSAPPLRLKTKGIFGVLTDSFYAHINPVLIVLFSFGFFNHLTSEKLVFGLILVPVLLLKGIRNILLHQVEDRKNDAKSGNKTFVSENGGLYTVHLLNKLLPCELAVTLLLIIFISYKYPPFLVFALLFTLITYFVFSGWKLPYQPARQRMFKFLYFMNDFFEGWMPLAFLVMLVVKNTAYLPLMVVHQILFPQFIAKLLQNFRKIAENFKTEEDY
jgi:1,4-dihydroxy-2-naphthoate octaprenyltransferase